MDLEGIKKYMYLGLKRILSKHGKSLIDINELSSCDVFIKTPVSGEFLFQLGYEYKQPINVFEIDIVDTIEKSIEQIKIRLNKNFNVNNEILAVKYKRMGVNDYFLKFTFTYRIDMIV